MKHAITWFEIPTVQLERAATFYEKVLGVELRRDTFMNVPHAFFPAERPAGVGGALIFDADRKPGASGTVPYLPAPRLETALDGVAAAGGKVVLGATDIGDPGTIALIRDTEGNLVGLHRPRG
jgi:uncharacterized protein